MTKGGRIEISTREKDQNAHFRISDNGPGMPTEAQDKIFESFLTQRPDGTGLGLSISKRILRSHRGDIKLEASSKKGTTFSFYLPFN
jgi:two-component system sensor histidine kinase AtoS